MKRIVLPAFIIAIAISMLLFACSKSTNNNTTNTSHGYWVIANQRYPINGTSRSQSNGYAVLGGVQTPTSIFQPVANNINFWFASFPVKSGSYQMVPMYSRTKVILGDNQIGISGSVFDSPNPHFTCKGTSYFDATGIANMLTWPWPAAANAMVTVTNGRISVDIPQTTTSFENPCALDSSYLTGRIQE